MNTKIALGLLTNRGFKTETVISLLNLKGEFDVILIHYWYN
jgi:hypothetical protein